MDVVLERYPGAMCDVESYIYMPLLEELNYVRRRSTSAPEILSHSRAIGEHYDLYSNPASRQKSGDALDSEDARWVISTNATTGSRRA